MVKIKEIWTESDFEEMEWSNSRLYSMSFPEEHLLLTLDIDYIFEWVLNDETNLYNFWISPCLMVFKNVLNLKINLSFQDMVGVDISEINKKSNGKNQFIFTIVTEMGNLEFESSGYEMKRQRQAFLSENIYLGRSLHLRPN